MKTARMISGKRPGNSTRRIPPRGTTSPTTTATTARDQCFRLLRQSHCAEPNEPVYYHNFGTTVYLFRKDAMDHFKINEPQVFDKALDLYARALQLDPQDFPLATDIAQTYYGIKPRARTKRWLAWNYALKIARDDIEREGVYIHFARVKLNAGRFDEAAATSTPSPTRCMPS